MILPNNRKHVHAWRRRGSEHFDDFALGIHMARLPVVETHHDFVADCCGGLRLPVLLYRRYRPHVNIMRETRIIRHYIVKIPRLLQRTDERVVSTFKDSNDAPFAPSFYSS